MLRQYWVRWVIPLIPIGLLFAARAFWTGIDALVVHRPGLERWAKLLSILMIIALSSISLKESITYVHLMTKPDTRTLAAQWLAANLPPGARVAREWYTPIIPVEGLSVTYKRYLYEWGSLKTLEQNFDYLVTSSDAYERFFEAARLSPANVEFYKEPVEFYQKLFQVVPVAEFKPDPEKTPGPIIRIYRMSRH
jgi:hypothetical protein